MRKPWLIPLLLWPLACIAEGGGDTLRAECSEFMDFSRSGQLEAESAGASYCLGLVNGVMGTNAIYRARAPESALFCPPDEAITNAQAAGKVVDYLEAHPEERDLDAISLVVFAFRAAYPCPAPGSG